MNRWIGVAVLDWKGEAFNGFYPEDVPEDWQLTWLANVAMAVVIPPERWLSVSPAIVSDWVKQTQENFWFYLLCDTEDQLSSAQTVAEYFPRQLGGIITAFHPKTNHINNIDLLIIGESVLLYHDQTLRQGQKLIRAWLDAYQGDHGLIVLTGKQRQNIREVQSLLSLLGHIHE